MLTCLVPVLFTFYVQGVLKLKKKNKNSGAKGLMCKAIMNVKVSICKHICYNLLHATEWNCKSWPVL